MQTYTALSDVHLEDAWLTVGVFDGLHRGHRAIIEPLVAGAAAAGAPSVVVTFDPHPATVFAGPQSNFLLTDIEERAALLAALGVHSMVALPFSAEMAAIPARDFVAQLSAHLKFSQLWVGYDFALGRKREGDAAFLRALSVEVGYDFRAFEPVMDAGEVISSSLIRERLLAGDLARANALLGRPYTLRGAVVPGDGRGRTIGVPTANVDTPRNRLVPANGVYACRVLAAGAWLPAVANIGVRPTFNEDEVAPRVEVHVLDYDSDLYGQQLSVQFVARLRDERKFDGIDALVAQIQADIEQGRALLADQNAPHI